MSEVVDNSLGNFNSGLWVIQPAFLMMYSAYKLNKQGDNIQLRRTPFPIWNQSVVPSPVLTAVSWAIYRFLRRQIRWSGIPISFLQFVVSHTVKGFSIVSEAEVESFFWNSHDFSMIQWMLAIWSLVLLPFLNPAWTSGRLEISSKKIRDTKGTFHER